VIDKGSAPRCLARYVPGGWHGGVDDGERPFRKTFANAGYRASVAGLRGWPDPPPKPFNNGFHRDHRRRTFRWRRWGERPVLIAPFLGGFVVQRLLEERHKRPGRGDGGLRARGACYPSGGGLRSRRRLTVDAGSTDAEIEIIATPAMAERSLLRRQTAASVRLPGKAPRAKVRCRLDPTPMILSCQTGGWHPILVLGARRTGSSQGEARHRHAPTRPQPECFDRAKPDARPGLGTTSRTDPRLAAKAATWRRSQLSG